MRKAKKKARKHLWQSIKMSQKAYLIIRVHKIGQTLHFAVWQDLSELNLCIGRKRKNHDIKCCRPSLSSVTINSWDVLRSQAICPFLHCRTRWQAARWYSCCSPWTSSDTSESLPEIGNSPTGPSSQISLCLRQDNCTAVRGYISSIALSKFQLYSLYIPSKRDASLLSPFAMAGIFNLLFNGANIGVFQADFSSFFANCVLVASIWIIVASYEVRGLDTTLSNFAVSDKPVFHGFENRHFEKIKHRLSRRIYLRWSK